MKLSVRFPNDETYSIDAEEGLSVQALLHKVHVYGKCGLPSQLSALHKGARLQPEDILTEKNVSDNDIIEIIINYGTVTPSDGRCYDTYISVMTPNNGDDCVPLDKQPVIVFRSSSCGQCLHLSCFLNITSLRSDSYGGDMESSLGAEEAARRGFVKWCDTELTHRVCLLQVTDPYMQKNIESKRYNFAGINAGYSGGDRYSWQRYTSKLPVDCFIHLDDIDNCIRLVPEEQLAPSTTYCIVLLHGIPTHPDDELDASLFSFSGQGISEDKVIFFKTQGVKPTRNSLFG